MKIYECLLVDDDGRKIRTVGYCTDIHVAEELAQKYASDSCFWQVRLTDVMNMEEVLSDE